MIIEAQIISPPYSGQFVERIYDNQSLWNSQDWTWIKFTNEDYSEWVGHFRGFPKEVAISKKHNTVLVLTADYLYQLDRLTADIIAIEAQPFYQNLTLTPNEDFIVNDYSHLYKIQTNVSETITLVSPIQMNMIKFKKWQGNKLTFTCETSIDWETLLLEYDCENDEIKVLG
ncbi:hypothetical protein [Emticicia agri]|uniref:Uncharacterized protein n=1 Tax=Emticicia agri TaxID=2492393 RepID=A0A4Q5M4V8_9BACT|nr:hypothetical protein [Emticicia agri]RYU97382.1 hypothetical protein EWM59_01445 [Emticicia agri]